VRLLAVQNHYPPFGYGYGSICRDVMESLRDRGHACTVLCAAGGEGGAVHVRTGLGHVPAAWRRPLAGLRGEIASQRLVREALAEGVDAALVWQMRGIGKGSLTLLHDAHVPVLYFLGDLWVVYERPGPPQAWRLWTTLDHFAPYVRLRRGLGRLAGLGRLDLRPPPIEDEGEVCFVSPWLRDRYAELGFRPRRARVLPNGVRLEDFAGPRTSSPAGELSMLFAGRLDPGKGADLAVSAVADVEGARLVLAGGGEERSVSAIREQVGRLDVADRTRLLGEIPRAEVARLMRDSDVLVMPARFPDSFGLIYVEAMAAGAVVVGTAKGGASAICEDGRNALVVGDEDVQGLAAALRRLRDDLGLRERLRAAGEETARGYRLEAMVDRVEELLDAGTQSSRAGCA
jgi:glycosyltransferase involved in cell wall biosynthesis